MQNCFNLVQNIIIAQMNSNTNYAIMLSDLFVICDGFNVLYQSVSLPRVWERWKIIETGGWNDYFPIEMHDCKFFISIL